MGNIDLKLTQNTDDYIYDISIGDGGDFSLVESFDTAIILSLFTDKRAEDSEVPSSLKRRGYFGNLSNSGKKELGSKLWLLDQARINQETLNLAIKYAEQALQWLIDDKYIRNLIVLGVISPNESTITLTIKFFLNNGQVNQKSYKLFKNSVYN